MTRVDSENLRNINSLILDDIPDIAADAFIGLTSDPKYLLPKYFYDKAGSEIFSEITRMPWYYLTECESEIFETHGSEIAKAISPGKKLRIIELGSGDGIKTRILIRHLLEKTSGLSFVPVDIDSSSIELLVSYMRAYFPALIIKPVNADYFRLAGEINPEPGTREVVLFLGSNIGNIDKNELGRFFADVLSFIMPGDYLLIGFDLKKSPSVIMKAYDDPDGVTARFNLNLLERLNRETGTDFNEKNFEHHTSYNPISGEEKSFLVSRKDHEVYSKLLGLAFPFKKWEPVFMEMSKKYDITEIETLASEFGFRIEKSFTDRRKYFCDSLWVKI